MIIPWGQWAPDSAGLDTKVLSEARNVYPLGGSFGPIAALAAYGTNNPFTGTNKCVGAIAVKTASGGWSAYAGSPTKLYKLVTSTWTDYSRLAGGAYAVSEGEYWSFAPFGTKLIVVNKNDDPQVIDIESGTNFAALGGTPPKASYVTTVGDFVVLAALATNTRKVRNSAINDSAGWTVGTSLCDEQEFVDGGRITGIAGGEFGKVAQEKALRRMLFQPGQDVAFRYERFEQEHGATAGYSLAVTANGIFFLSDSGFFKYSEAEGLVAIGANRINKWYRDNSDVARFFSTISFTDSFGPRVYWAFYNASSSTVFDRILIYDWKLDEWTYTDGVSAQYFMQFAAPSTTLEGLDVYGDIDSGLIPYPFDSRIWEGGRPVVGAINTDGGLSFLEGSTPLTALLRTPPRRLVPGRRAKVTSVEPLGIFNGAAVGIRIGKQENTNTAASYTSSITPSTSSGVARLIASARQHTFEQTITQSSGTSWAHAQGIDVTAAAEGIR